MKFGRFWKVTVLSLAGVCAVSVAATNVQVDRITQHKQGDMMVKQRLALHHEQDAILSQAATPVELSVQDS